MRSLKSVLFGFAMVALSACGSSQPATTIVAQAPVYLPVPTATPNGGVQTGYNNSNGSYTTTISGGTRTLTQVLPTYGSQAAYLTGTYRYTETASVSAGDIVMVQASSAMANHYGSFTSGYSNLTNLNVRLSTTSGTLGNTLGTSLYGIYAISQSGTLNFESDWAVYNSSGTHVVNFNGGGVFVAHCVTTAGAAMNCPN